MTGYGWLWLAMTLEHSTLNEYRVQSTAKTFVCSDTWKSQMVLLCPKVTPQLCSSSSSSSSSTSILPTTQSNAKQRNERRKFGIKLPAHFPRFPPIHRSMHIFSQKALQRRSGFNCPDILGLYHHRSVIYILLLLFYFVVLQSTAQSTAPCTEDGLTVFLLNICHPVRVSTLCLYSVTLTLSSPR